MSDTPTSLEATIKKMSAGDNVTKAELSGLENGRYTRGTITIQHSMDYTEISFFQPKKGGEIHLTTWTY